MLAAASNAIVVGFNTKITDTARRAAEAEGVDVRLYDIIYKLTDDIEAALKGLLEPEIVEVVEGRAEVRQVIRVGKSTVIAGSFVTDGRIVRGGARVWRGGKVIATDRIESLRRFRDDVREVQANYECGIGLANFHDIWKRATSSNASPPRPSAASPPADRALERAAASTMSQRTERVDELLRQEIGGDRDPGGRAIRGSGSRRSPRSRPRRTCATRKVWVSVIGQPAERDATIARPRPGDAVRAARAGPDAAASSASRTSTSQLDDTAERGTRVLQLLDELEAGAAPDADDLPLGEIAADPGRARAATRATRPRSRRPRCIPPVRPPAPRARPWQEARPSADDVDLRPYLDAVPAVVVDRLRGARRVLAVSHENPDADTLGATLAVAAIVEALGGERTTRSARTRCRRSTTSWPASSGSAPIRTPTPPYDLLVISDCGSLDRVGAVRGAARRPVRAPAARRHRPPRLERRRPAPPTGSTRTPPPRARWSRCSPPGSACRSTSAAGRSPPH